MQDVIELSLVGVAALVAIGLFTLNHHLKKKDES